MAAGNFTAYQQGQLEIANRSADFVGGTIKAMLLTASYTPNAATDQYLDDISANECADGDYARQTVGSKTIALASGKVRFDCADIDFGNAVTITAKYLVLFLDTGTPGTSTLLWYCDLNTGGGSVSSTAADFDIAINASGIYEITP